MKDGAVSVLCSLCESDGPWADTMYEVRELAVEYGWIFGLSRGFCPGCQEDSAVMVQYLLDEDARIHAVEDPDERWRGIAQAAAMVIAGLRLMRDQREADERERLRKRHAA